MSHPRGACRPDRPHRRRSGDGRIGIDLVRGADDRHRFLIGNRRATLSVVPSVTVAAIDTFYTLHMSYRNPGVVALDNK